MSSVAPRPGFRRSKTHGRTVVELELREPGTNDLIGHTLFHFLQLEEGWGEAKPRAALPPGRVLEAIDERGWKRPPRAKVFDPRWWSEPRRDLVLRAHDEGYYPRYALLIEKAGAIEAPGSAWQTEPRRCLSANVQGFNIVVLPADGELRVKTAHSTPVIQPGTGNRGFRLGDIAARHRRDSAAPASTSGEGAVLPDGARR